MAVQHQRPLRLVPSVPDWQVSLLVTLAMALSLLGLVGIIHALPQESGGPTQQSIQTNHSAEPQNFSVGEQKSGASAVGQH